MNKGLTKWARESLFLLASLLPILAWAQTLSLSTTVPPAVEVCHGMADFSLEMHNTSGSTMDSVVATVDLPPGMNYQPGSVSGAVELDITDLESPRFLLLSLGAGTTATVQYQAAANCALVPYVQAGNLAVNSTTASYKVGPAHFTATEADPESYNVRFADLVITSVSNAVVTRLRGQTTTRTLEITNGGNGPLTEFSYSMTLASGLEVLGVSHGSLSTSPMVLGVIVTLGPSDFALIGDGDGLFEQDEVILVTDTTLLTGCPGGQTTYTLYFGCNETFCDGQGDTDFAFINAAQGSPAIQVHRAYLQPNSTCPGDISSYAVTYRNNGFEIDPGGGGAFDLYLDLEAEGTVYNAWDLLTLNVGGTPITGLGAAVTDTVPVYGGQFNTLKIFFSQLTFDPDGPGGISDLDGDGRFDDLALGDSLVITGTAALECPGEWGNACLDLSDDKLTFMGMIYKNHCDQFLPALFGPELGRFTTGTNGVEDAYGPVDLVDGQTGTFTFQSGFADQGPKMSGYTNLVLNSAGADLYLVLPSGLNYVTGSALNDGVPIGATQVGDTLFFDPITPVTDAYFLYFPDQVTVDLTLDCGAVTTLGPQELQWVFSYTPDTNCRSCTWNITCQSHEVYLHCPGTCPYLATTSMQAERTNLGWTDATLTTRVTPSTPGLLLDKAYLCDSLRATVPGTVFSNGIDSVHVKVYASELIPSSATFQAVGGTFVIQDASTGTTLTCAAPSPTINSAGGITYYDYDATTCLLSLLGGSLDAGDQITLLADFTVSNLAGLPNTLMPVNVFRAYHYTLVDGVEQSCDNWGTSFGIVQKSNYRPLESFAYGVCDQDVVYYRIYRDQGGIPRGDEFPNEYRPILRFDDDLKFNLPTGFHYVPGTSYLAMVGITPGIYPVPVPDPVYDPGTHSLTYSFDDLAPGSIPVLEDNTYKVFELQFEVEAGCDHNGSYALVTSDISYTDMPYSACPTTVSHLVNATYVAEIPPSLALSSPQTTVNGFERQISWPVRLCAPGGTSGSWLGFSTPDNTIAVDYLVDLTTGDTVNVVVSPTGEYVASTSALTFNECRDFIVVAHATDCNEANLKVLDVRAGYSCSAFTGYEPDGCPTSTLTLFLNPKKADLQVEIFTPSGTPFDLCTPLVYEAEIMSSRNGNMYDILAAVHLPTGMAYLPGSAEFSHPLASGYAAAPDPTVSGTGTLLWELADLSSSIAANGLVGLRDTTQNKARIRFQVTTGCDYVSGSAVSIQVQGSTNCDSLILSDFQTDPQFVIGTADIYTTTPRLASDGFTACTGSTTATLTTLVNGPGSVSGNDNLILFLPSPLAYTVGSFAGIHNAPALGMPISTSVPGGTEYTWQLPPGISAGDSVVFSIGLEGAATLACGSLPWTLTTTFLDTATCVSLGTVCALEGQSGTGSGLLHLLKADLLLSSATATQTCGSTFIQVELQNSASVDMPAGTDATINAYCDSDGDGTLGAGDALIATAPVGFLGAGSSASMLLSGTSLCGTSAFVVLDPGTACICAGDTAATGPVTVLPDPDPGFIPVYNCDNGSVEFLSIAGAEVTHTWDFGDGSATSADVTPLHLYTTAGPYQVIHSINSLCGTFADTMTVTPLLPPVVEINATTENVCLGESVTLTATGGGTYYWSTGETTASITVTPGSTVPHLYTVFVASDGGCVGADDILILVNPAPLLDGTALPASCSGSADGSIHTVATGGTAPYTYLWSDGATTADRPALAAGPYTVTLTDAAGCTATASYVVTSPAPISLSLSGVNPGCGGTDGSISTTVSPSGGVANYLWSNGSTSPSLTGIGAGTYCVTVTVEGCTATACTTLVESGGTVSAEIDCCEDTYVCAGSTASIPVTFTGGGPWTYTWSDGTSLHTATSATPLAHITLAPAATTTLTLVSVSSPCGTGTVCGKATVAVQDCRRCSHNCFKAIPLSVASSGSCQTVTLRITCDGTCTRGLSNMVLSIPCGTYAGGSNTGGWPMVPTSPSGDPNTGLQGIKVDNLTGDFCRSSIGSFDVTYTLCGLDAACGEPCLPLIGWKAGNCVYYSRPTGSAREGDPEVHTQPAAEMSLTAAPNPFTHGTTLIWDIPQSEDGAVVEIWDASGQLVRSAILLPGSDRQWEWDANDQNGRAVAAGLYQARVTLGSQVATVKLLLLN